jgi:hypothetical protein
MLCLIASAPATVIQATAETTTMAVNPQTIIDPTLTPTKTFQINITANNVTDLYGWEFKLYYLKSVLTLNQSTFGPFLETGGTTFTIDKSNSNYNETHGLVWLADSLLAAPSGVNGSGTLASIKFTVNQFGSTQLDLKETKMGTKTGQTISHEAIDGYFSNVISNAKIAIYPDRIINSSLEPCNNFSINITITDAVNVNNWELKLFYKHDILNVSQVEFGPFLQSTGPTNQLIQQLTDDYNETHGIVWLSETLISQTSASGNGVLATITFHVEEVGETNLTLTDTLLKDPAGQPLSHTCYGSYFNNMLMAKIFIDPEEILDPTLTPGAILNVSIKITEVTELYSYKFNITFDSQILNCLGVLTIPHLNETHYNSTASRNDNIGEIFFEVKYYDPAEPITSFTPFEVARIFFQVENMGVSPLHFHDTEMTDYDGNPIEHATQDGLIFIAIRDVAVSDVTADKTVIYPGELININVTVENRGNLTESFVVRLAYNSHNIANLTVTDLSPGSQLIISYVWNTTGFPPCYNASLIVYAGPVPYERNLDDNTFTDGIINITLIGDVNGDGTVDVYDLTLAAVSFASNVGDPEYDERADINHDGTVDIYDLILIGKHFGEHY